jgi:hypothetical protein
MIGMPIIRKFIQGLHLGFESGSPLFTSWGGPDLGIGCPLLRVCGFEEFVTLSDVLQVVGDA